MDRPHLDFTLALHGQLPTDGNLAWSPYSVASALGLAAAGARGVTYAELARVLAPGGDLDDLGRLLARSADLAQAEVAVANSLWTLLGQTFHDAYLRAVSGWPGGAVHTADFRGDADGARRRINADVEQTTRRLVTELLQPGMITPETVAVIVSALYLKVAWASRFPVDATRPALFHAPSGDRRVPTMCQRVRVGYAAAAGWRMATLRTASQVVVDVLLPADTAAAADTASAADGDRAAADGDGEGSVRRSPDPPTPETFTRLYAASRSATVDLALPRFRVETAALLNEPLQRLGVAAAFSRGADFSGITSAARIRVDQVVHKALLRVDENGVEGAAATAVVMRAVSLNLEPPVPFHVDRPFLVVVRHARTGAVYFLGRVAEPSC